MTMCACSGRGSILAWDRQNLGSSPFVFKCCTNKNWTNWETRDKARWVTLDQDPQGVTGSWVLDMVERGQQDSEEFKEKIKIWGRDFIVSLWKQSAQEKSDQLNREKEKETKK